MTRRSRSNRSRERRLDDLEEPHTDPRTVEEWVEDYIATADEFGFNHTVVDSDGEPRNEPDHTGQVRIMDCGTSHYTGGVWTDEVDIPVWVDIEEDLPV